MLKNLNKNYYDKYPTYRLLYAKTVGELRQRRIATILSDIFPMSLGFKIFNNKLQGNGYDLGVEYNNKIIAKFEVSNENPDAKSYINKKRAIEIKENLKGVRNKALIISSLNIIRSREVKKILKNIPKIVIGFQSLPYEYYIYYSEKGEVNNRKIDDNSSLNHVKEVILSFFQRNNPDLLMYIHDIKSTNKMVPIRTAICR